MGIANDILNLRDNHSSSVALLLGALDQIRNAPANKLPTRSLFVTEAAQLVLTNVAAHAAEALAQSVPFPENRGGSSAPRRRRHRFDSGAPSRQRILFALN